MERERHSSVERDSPVIYREKKEPNLITREKKELPLITQMRRRVETIIEKKDYDGYFPGNNISTGSTLLDLAISGGRVRGGGLPGGVLVEIFGPSGSGKTILLSEIAGDIQRKGGEVKFNDPEARLNQQFAKMFGMELKEGEYHQPDTVPEVFETLRSWNPPKKKDLIHGIMADSLAALSTEMEMEKKEGDKMGMRRAKEFSEELRKTCRILKQNNYLMVCSNQVRINVDGGNYAPKYTTPGGEAIGFYSSLRLKTKIIEKIKKKKKFHGEDVTRVVGVNIEVEVFKNSIWKPYGIDDIRQNLQFLKDYSNKSVYTLGCDTLDKSMDESIAIIEKEGREEELRQEVIMLWDRIEFQFNSHRKPKR
jgi:recombination protein RecA